MKELDLFRQRIQRNAVDDRFGQKGETCRMGREKDIRMRRQRLVSEGRTAFLHANTDEVGPVISHIPILSPARRSGLQAAVRPGDFRFGSIVSDCSARGANTMAPIFAALTKS